MNELQPTAVFNGMPLPIIMHGGAPHLTAESIGQALEYEFPRQAITKIYERNAEELAEYSVVVNVMTSPGGFEVKLTSNPLGGNPTMRLFNEEGVMVITMLSRQPRAREFRRWAVKVLKAYRHGEPLATEPKGRMARIDAATLREYRLINSRLAQAYLLEAGINGAYVGELLTGAGAAPMLSYAGAEPQGPPPAPLAQVRERIGDLCDGQDDRWWYCTRHRWERVCAGFDATSTARALRELGLLKHIKNRLISLPPKSVLPDRPGVYSVSKDLLLDSAASNEGDPA